MGKGLAKSYIASIVMIIVGIALILLSVVGTANKTPEQIQSEKWRGVFIALGIILIILSVIGQSILDVVMEYKILKNGFYWGPMVK